MDQSSYDPYQDNSPPFDPHAHNQKHDQYPMVQQQTELLDPHYEEDFHKGPRPGVTTRTEAAQFQEIKWPDGPSFLRTAILFDTMTFLLEGILVLMSLAFLSLAILACHWNNMPSNSDQAAGMEQAMKLVGDRDPLQD
jgi:hypothetical protein